jgi:xylulokinase
MSDMGLDVGQTGCRAIIFDEGGTQLAFSYCEYPTLVPEKGWAELDSEGVKNACFAVMKDAQQQCPADPVRGLGISTQGEAFTPIGPEGECLANAMITFDTRATIIAEQWSNQFGIKKLYTITGHTAHPMFSLFKLLWLKNHRPEIFDKAVKFLCFEDFIQHSLGIEPHVSWSLAGRTMLFNIRAHRWEQELLEAVGISPSKLAILVPSGEKVGTIPSSVARHLGFGEEVVVVSGGHDQPLGALGAGVTSPRLAMYATGTSECITPVFQKPVLNDSLMRSNLCTYDYAIREMYTTVAFSLTGGNILKWFRDVWGKPEADVAAASGRDVYEILLERIGNSPSGLLVLPYFTPSGTPYFDTEVPGSITGIRLSTKREQVLRALLEGVAFEMRLNLDILEKSHIIIKELRAIGGGARSKIWTQLKADVLNKPITTVEETEAACFAAAMLARAKRTGEPLESIVGRWVKTGEVIEPNEENASFYADQFESYKKLYPAMKSVHR